MLKESAVIVLHEQNTDSIILTKRTKHLRDHPGEVCFPGGRWEPGDTDLWATALRELNEELGIAMHRIELVEKLETEQTLNNVIIHPWLTKIPTIEPYVPNHHEVAEVIMLPMRDVRALSNYKDISINRAGRLVMTCQFTASHYFVWGATARIMRQLSR